jgi:hypothetical protein
MAQKLLAPLQAVIGVIERREFGSHMSQAWIEK